MNIKNNTKEYIKGFIIFLFFIGLLIVCNKIETNYTREGFVKEVQGQNVVVEDTKGNLWEYFTDGLKVNTKVTLKMHNNHTSTIKDDYILDIIVK